MPPAEEPLRIKSVTFHNFKSLKNFTLELSKFTCLIGLNGAGKSTVLQAFDFLSRLMRGNLTGWLEERQWKIGDLRCHGETRSRVSAQFELIRQNGTYFGQWSGRFQPSTLKCEIEFANAADDQLQSALACWMVSKDASHQIPHAAATSRLPIQNLIHEAGTLLRRAIDSNQANRSSFRFEGSILSQLEDNAISTNLVRLRNTLAETRSLELLSPENLRLRTRDAKGELGAGGQQLAAFLHELGEDKRQAIVERLNLAYPNLVRIDVRSLRSGWKQLEIIERFGERMVRTEARHASEGMLRLIAITASLYREQSCLLFDEIENGINPELTEFVVDLLVNAPTQVIVTTHSPLFLNWLTKEDAERSVYYLYKTPQGETKAVPFFSIPSMKRKLKVMGPGEAFVDTVLPDLEKELAEMPAPGGA